MRKVTLFLKDLEEEQEITKSLMAQKFFGYTMLELQAAWAHRESAWFDVKEVPTKKEITEINKTDDGQEYILLQGK